MTMTVATVMVLVLVMITRFNKNIEDLSRDLRQLRGYFNSYFHWIKYCHTLNKYSLLHTVVHTTTQIICSTFYHTNTKVHRWNTFDHSSVLFRADNNRINVVKSYVETEWWISFSLTSYSLFFFYYSNCLVYLFKYFFSPSHFII